ncbi:hypothetical protein [Pseudomonas sp. RIT-PI-S]|nr:hypothetical protein [Pseudomonas sp. RIT-PI-S]
MTTPKLAAQPLLTPALVIRMNLSQLRFLPTVSPAEVDSQVKT